MHRFLLICFILFVFINSCKPPVDEDKADAMTCRNIQNLTITSNSPVTIGEPITFSVPEVGGYRIYNWHGPDNFVDHDRANTIDYAELKHEGWYYITVSNPTCDPKVDSVYIDVKLKQGTPSCTASDNSCYYSNLGSDNFSTVRVEIAPTFNFKSLYASGGWGTAELNVFFHDAWQTREPEDGIYTTVNIPSFGQFDANYNKVYVKIQKQGLTFGSQASQNVYVSHVNGKLRVQFCDLGLSANNGTGYQTKASATLTQK